MYPDYTLKSGSRHKNWCIARVLSFLIRYFSNYYTLHRSDLAARAASLDPRLMYTILIIRSLYFYFFIFYELKDFSACCKRNWKWVFILLCGLSTSGSKLSRYHWTHNLFTYIWKSWRFAKKMKKEITQNRSLNDLCTSAMHYELISASVHNRCLKNVSETSRVKTR